MVKKRKENVKEKKMNKEILQYDVDEIIDFEFKIREMIHEYLLENKVSIAILFCMFEQIKHDLLHNNCIICGNCSEDEEPDLTVENETK